MLPKYKIFLFLLLAFIVGVGSASFIEIDFFLIFCLFLIAILFLFFFWSDKKLRIIGFVLIFICLGIIRYNLSWPPITPDKIQFYNNQKANIQGRVVNLVPKLDKIEIVLESEKVIQEREVKNIKGRILIYAPLYTNVQYGDRLETFCHLYQPEPFEGFLYHEYLAKQNIYSICFSRQIEILEQGKGNFFIGLLYKIRNRVKITIEKTLTEPEGSILSALLLGIKKEIPQETRDWFALSGVAHVLAISGLHVMILSKLLLYLAIIFLGLARPKAFYFVVSILIFYVLLAGAPASAIRAAIMGSLLIFAEKIGRRRYGLNLIVLAAFVMLLFNPKLLKSDIGFQLSFSAALGIVLLESYFLRIFNFLRFLPDKLRAVQGYLATTCSAYLFSLPLVLFYFGNLSLIAPIANVLILPVLPLLMILGFIFAFSSFIYFGLAQLLAWPIWLILRYLVLITKNLSAVPYFSFNLGEINWWLMVLMYLILIFFVKKIKAILKTRRHTNDTNQ